MTRNLLSTSVNMNRQREEELGSRNAERDLMDLRRHNSKGNAKGRSVGGQRSYRCLKTVPRH